MQRASTVLSGASAQRARGRESWTRSKAEVEKGGSERWQIHSRASSRVTHVPVGFQISRVCLSGERVCRRSEGCVCFCLTW